MSLIASAIVGILIIGAVLTTVPFLIWIERKIAAYSQNRLGPNRVGPRGILQAVADGIKILAKENFIPAQAGRGLFYLAPILTMFGALAVLAVIPFGGILTLAHWNLKVPIQVAPGLDVGIVFIVMIASASVYGIILGGWSANNKYSFYGALRSAAQILSYEVPLGLCLLAMILMAGDLKLETFISQQLAHSWLIFYQPGVFLIMLVCAFAETNRLPFDTPEAEQELVAGYHTEYSSMEFGLFFLGEYTHIIADSALIVTLFLGGWHLPFLITAVEGSLAQTLLKLIIFSAKIALLIFVFMWVRWTLPRFRFDQILRLTWIGLTPLTLLLLSATSILVFLRLNWTFWMPLANILILAVLYLSALMQSRFAGRRTAT